MYPKNHGISTSHWWGPGDPRPARPRPLAILTHPGPNPSISSQGYGSVMILRLRVLCCRGFCWWFCSAQKNHGPQGFCSAKFSAKFTGFTLPTSRNLRNRYTWINSNCKNCAKTNPPKKPTNLGRNSLHTKVKGRS